MPHADDAETGVIGALLVESNAICQVIDFLKPEMFYDSRNELIYQAILSLYDKNIKIDMIAVSKELENAGELESAGGYENIINLTGQIFSAANIEQYGLYVKQKYVQRKLIETGYRIQNLALDNTQDVSDTLDFAAKEIETIMSGAINESSTVDISEASESAYMKYLERENAVIAGEKTGITTGLISLDKYTGGLQPGELFILAARPAMGKTAFMLHMSKSAAEQGKHAVIFNLEMTRESLAARLMFSYADIDTDRFKTGQLSKYETQMLYDAKDCASRLPILINDTPSISIRKIKNIASQLKKRGKCDVIYIDYLQLIDMRNENRSYNREQEVAQVSRQCKIMSKELALPVVLLSQLNRECERRSDKTPLLSDLRESGAVEQDADIIAFVHRPEYYDEFSEVGRGQIVMAKNRHGDTGKIEFHYDKTMTKISNFKQNQTPF